MTTSDFVMKLAFYVCCIAAEAVKLADINDFLVHSEKGTQRVHEPEWSRDFVCLRYARTIAHRYGTMRANRCIAMASVLRTMVYNNLLKEDRLDDLYRTVTDGRPADRPTMLEMRIAWLTLLVGAGYIDRVRLSEFADVRYSQAPRLVRHEPGMELVLTALNQQAKWSWTCSEHDRLVIMRFVRDGIHTGRIGRHDLDELFGSFEPPPDRRFSRLFR